jgi:membrane peptidoglycan carboxypeptidase
LADRNGHTTFGIGIGDYAVTPLDQAVGFATLANGGKKNDPYLVQKATASDGEIVYSHHSSAKQAIDKRVANDVTLTLKPVAAWSNDALDGGRQSGAKTGTEGITKKNSTDNSDAWMVGFTPQVSASVWVGTGVSKPIYNAAGQPLYGADLPGKTWKRFMDRYLSGKPMLKLPNKQLIAANGGTPTPTPTHTAPPSTPTSKAPKPTFSITSGFPTSAPPTQPPSTPKTTPTPTPTATCGVPGKPPCKPTTTPGPVP